MPVMSQPSSESASKTSSSSINSTSQIIQTLQKLKLPVHLALLGTYTACLLKNIKMKMVHFPEDVGANEPYLFLTYWTVTLHILYYSSTTLPKLFPNFLGFKKYMTEQRNNQIQDVLWRTAYPLGCFVPIIFWFVYNIDRELIYPSKNDEFSSQFDNHSMHTLTAISYASSIILQDLILPVDTKSLIKPLTISNIFKEIRPSYLFTFIYYNSVCGYFKIFGKWPYDFFHYLWVAPYWSGYIGLAIFAFCGMSSPVLLTQLYYRLKVSVMSSFCWMYRKLFGAANFLQASKKIN